MKIPKNCLVCGKPFIGNAILNVFACSKVENFYPACNAYYLQNQKMNWYFLKYKKMALQFTFHSNEMYFWQNYEDQDYNFQKYNFILSLPKNKEQLIKIFNSFQNSQAFI